MSHNVKFNQVTFVRMSFSPNQRFNQLLRANDVDIIELRSSSAALGFSVEFSATQNKHLIKLNYIFQFLLRLRLHHISQEENEI